MKAQPLISVIIPVHNGEKYLLEAVDSTRRQNYADLELIFVDDGSTDRTAEIVKGLVPQASYVFQQNRGPATARNTGLALARGSIIAFLDADDLWPGDKLARQLPKLVDDPELDIVSGRIQRIKLAGVSEGKESFKKFMAPVLSYNLGGALFRKSVFDRVGPFDVTMRFSEDVDWWMRAREIGARMLMLRQVTLLYRLHGENMTRGQDVLGLQFLEALKKSLDRRRQSGRSPDWPLPVFSEFEEAAN